MTTATQPRIAYDKVGDGTPALVLLPGWAAERTMFRRVLADLGRERTVIALDWRGHGGSQQPDSDYGGDDLVDDALSVIATEGIQRIVPVAQAHAGWTAIELRNRLGADRVPGMISISWSVLGAPPALIAALGALQCARTWEQTRDTLLDMWITGVQDAEVVTFVQSMADYGFDMWSRAGREIAAQFARFSTPVAALETLDPPCPMLHLYAQPADPDFLAAQQTYAADHRWFSVQQLSGSSHFPTIESPTEVAAAVAHFVSML